MQDLGRAGDRIRVLVERRATAVVALPLVVHGLLHVRAEPEAVGEVGGDLAMRGHRLMRQRPATGGEGGQPGDPPGQRRVQPHLGRHPGEHAARAVHVDQVEVEPGGQFLVGEERGQHRAARAAAHILD